MRRAGAALGGCSGAAFRHESAIKKCQHVWEVVRYDILRYDIRLLCPERRR